MVPKAGGEGEEGLSVKWIQPFVLPDEAFWRWVVVIVVQKCEYITVHLNMGNKVNCMLLVYLETLFVRSSCKH